MKISSVVKINYPLSLLLFCLLFIQGVCLQSLHAQCGGLQFRNLPNLMVYLQDNTRRNPEYRIIQTRYDQPTAPRRHIQYEGACYFFTLAPIIEYLGYSRFIRYGSYPYGFYYPTTEGRKYHSRSNFDAGYYLSPEYLMAKNIRYETIYNLCRSEAGEMVCDTFDDRRFYSDANKTLINTNSRNCSRRFGVGEEYGECSNLNNNYGAWMDYVGTGCHGTNCRQDAESGMYWFANHVLRRDCGCNDMKDFTPDTTSSSDILHMRRIIKGFIDHNIPLLVSVRDGRHFEILVGYLDLDYKGLPKNAIITYGRNAYMIVPIALPRQWSERHDCSLQALYPWNQHLDGGCESEGWATKLDKKSSKFKLGRMPDGWSVNCSGNRIYGTKIECIERDTSDWVRAEYFAYDSDHFITDTRLISCDKIKMQYSDGEHTVESAEIQRYWYSPDKEKWYSGPTYYPDVLRTQNPTFRRPGPLNIIEWDSAWPDNYWVIAEGLSGTYTKRRTTITMVFTDGTTKTIELSPPNTYGIFIDCFDNGSLIKSYLYEADHGVFRAEDGSYPDKLFLYEFLDKSCDKLALRVNLGEETPHVATATIQQMYFSTAEGEWLPAQSPWWPDRSFRDLYDGLSGYTREIVWDNVWPDDNWYVADKVGSGSNYGDRKTVIRLLDGSLDLIREIEIVPY